MSDHMHQIRNAAINDTGDVADEHLGWGALLWNGHYIVEPISKLDTIPTLSQNFHNGIIYLSEQNAWDACQMLNNNKTRRM